MPLLPESQGTFVDLRSVGWGVPRPEASVLAHARGLLHWRQRHKFCGVCGNPCEVKSAGHVMQCTVCNTQHFPRTDPAVIMLVTDGDRALLGQPNAFRNVRVFTTLAGFVEPGESLEEAVARDAAEHGAQRNVAETAQADDPRLGDRERQHGREMHLPRRARLQLLGLQ